MLPSKLCYKDFCVGTVLFVSRLVFTISVAAVLIFGRFSYSILAFSLFATSTIP
jgi:hypothetical protein